MKPVPVLSWVLAVSLLTACEGPKEGTDPGAGGPGGPGVDANSLCDLPPSVPPTPGPDATDATIEVDYSPCDLVSTVVTADDARGSGFPVDADLAMLARGVDTTFHRGDGCGMPSADGRLTMAIALRSIEVVHPTPNEHAPPMYVCPPDFVAYRTTIDLRTDDGSVRGSFDLELTGPHGLSGGAAIDVRQFAGTLGIRVDLARPRQGFMGIQVMLQDSGASGQLFTGVGYGDGTGDQGDGEFWPASDTTRCGWLVAPATPKSSIIALDQYDALCGMREGGADEGNGGQPDSSPEASEPGSAEASTEASRGGPIEASLEPDDGAPDCGYAQPHNDPGCPAMYSQAFLGEPCAPTGLGCQYPGVGDGDPAHPGCYSTAGLACLPADAGVGGGPLEAGSSYWITTQ